MGQYYKPILITEKGTTKVFSRDVDGEYTMAKLMEHSCDKKQSIVQQGYAEKMYVFKEN